MNCKPKKKPKKLINVVLFSYTFPEGIYVGYSFTNDLETLKKVMTDICYKFPISYLLKKYDYIKPKILSLCKIYKNDNDDLYQKMREVIDKYGYPPGRLLNNNLKLYSYTDDVIKKQKINMNIFFNNEYNSDEDLSLKKRKSF